MEPLVDFDFDREERTFLPEAVFCSGKALESVLELLRKFANKEASACLFTRLNKEVFLSLEETYRDKYSFDEISGTAFNKKIPSKTNKKVAIVSAGTSDAPISREAARTLEFLSIDHSIFEDCGVAGLWRLQKHLPAIKQHQIVIAVAGMEGALPSVLSGLIKSPIIAVPTSIGYGVCNSGMTALNSMLASCSPGIAVVNIDNGFGAACFAAKTLFSLS